MYKEIKFKNWGKIMKNIFKGAISVAASVFVLSGCSGGKNGDNVNTIDVGSIALSGSLFPNSVPDVSVGSISSSSSSDDSRGSFSASSSTSSGTISIPTRSSSESSPTLGPPSYPAKPFKSSVVSNEAMGGTGAVSTKGSSSSLVSSKTSSSSSSSTSVSSEADPKPDIPPSTNTYKPLNYTEVKGVWISFLEIREMPSKSPAEFRKAIGEVYDNCVSLGINTVYVHARSHGDAYYDSDLFAYTKYLSGGFDALEIMIDEAHKRDLSFQAWINPLRGCEAKDAARHDGYLLGEWIKDGKRAVNVNGVYYLNPAYDEVIKLITDGAAEIVSNYDVDGLHIDDYFYPTTDASFDKDAFRSSSYNNLSEFRFANCDRFVKELYKAVKACNSNAVFGISCQGNLQNNYDYMYADVKKWCTEEGYTDYIMPQIYFGFENASQPFAECVRTWDNLALSGNKIPLIVGITFSKIGVEDTWAGRSGKREWITDKEIVKRQFLESMEQQAYGGICLFSYKNIFTPAASVKAQVDAEAEALRTVLKK